MSHAAAPDPGATGLAGKLPRSTLLGGLALFVALLAAWQWLPAHFAIPAYVVPPASSVALQLWHLTEKSHLVTHLAVTTLQVVAGFALGSLLGMVVGYSLGLFRRAETLLAPYILALQIAPKVAFAPLFVMWFGFSVYPKILVAILITFFPIMVNVLGAMRVVDRDLVNLARSLDATRMQVFWKIEFPASMPALFSGLRVGSTLAVIGIVVGEFVGGNTGLGYVIIMGEGQGNTATVFAAIVLLTVIGIALYGNVAWLERRVLHYLQRDHAADV